LTIEQLLLIINEAGSDIMDAAGNIQKSGLTINK
jgi:hypothetical protein